MSEAKNKSVFLIKFRGGRNSTCLDGYEGPLCDHCVYSIDEKKYYKLGQDCVECYNIPLLIIYNSLQIFGSLLFLLYTIK